MNAASQNEEKFIALYRRMVDEVYQYVSQRIGFDSTTAEDITQDIFLDVYRGMNGFKGLCSERTWIFRIAQNKLCDYYRRQYRQTAQTVVIDDELAEQLDDDTQNVVQAMETAADSRIIRQLLDSLPGHYRAVLLLKYCGGKSTKQIAKIAGKSPKSIESELHRAKSAFIKAYHANHPLR